MRSWRYEFECLTPEEMSATDEYLAKYGHPKPWYDCLPPALGFERKQRGRAMENVETKERKEVQHE